MKPSASATMAKPSAASAGAKPMIGKGAIGGGKPGDSSDVAKLQAEIQDIRMNMDTVEKERDFYFGKLRDIELLLQANE
jgi:RP/EB family microtubule-associated protein